MDGNIFLRTYVCFRNGSFDSVLGKRVLTYWENRGNGDYNKMNGFMVGMENYTFLERGNPHLSKNV